MLQIAVILHLFGLDLVDQAHTRLSSAPERGSETIEKILWAVAVVAIVAAAVAVIRAFVASEAAKL